ncbi:SgcJ/EcaC family oxidoreductase [Actinosynnema sp. NPDC059797]
MGGDEDAIRRLIADAERLQGDPAGFPDLFAEDGVIVNFGGRRVRGRERIREAMAAALSTPLADVTTRHEVVDVAFLRPDVALADVVKHVSDGRAESAKESTGAFGERGRMSFVLVKDAAWRIALAHTTPVRT